jgi:hypothetical protein
LGGLWLALILQAACGFDSSQNPLLPPIDDAPGIPFVPQNGEPPAFDNFPDWDLDCGDALFDSDAMSFSGCVAEPPMVSASGDEAYAFILVNGLKVDKDSKLRMVGSRPVILFVYGDAEIDGKVYADSNTTGDADELLPGAGASNCLEGGLFGGNAGGNAGGGGGGGGGFGTAGQSGGNGGTGSVASTAGLAGGGNAESGNAELTPLRGGCPGGPGGSRSGSMLRTPGGFGGGAFQISVGGRLRIQSGNLSASGAGGRGGTQRDGGGGGGSGGGILVEAHVLEIGPKAIFVANGGGGGEGGINTTLSTCDDGECSPGNDGSDVTSVAAAGGTGDTSAGGDGGIGASLGAATIGLPGSNNAGGAGGGGGGGAGAGRIRIVGHLSCDLNEDAVTSPPPSVQCP